MCSQRWFERARGKSAAWQLAAALMSTPLLPLADVCCSESALRKALQQHLPGALEDDAAREGGRGEHPDRLQQHNWGFRKGPLQPALDDGAVGGKLDVMPAPAAAASLGAEPAAVVQLHAPSARFVGAAHIGGTPSLPKWRVAERMGVTLNMARLVTFDGNAPQRVMLDTGAQPVLLGSSMVRLLGLQVQDLELSPISIKTARLHCLVTGATTCDVPLGTEFLYPCGISMDLREEVGSYRPGYACGEGRKMECPMQLVDSAEARAVFACHGEAAWLGGDLPPMVRKKARSCH
eukprot:SM000112S24008  [mRNA]  locus=s112:399355:400263:+ [translate_table: standard]